MRFRNSRFVSVVGLFVLLSFSFIVIVGASSVMWSLTCRGIGHDLATTLGETSYGGFALADETNSFDEVEADLWLVKTDENGDIPEFSS